MIAVRWTLPAALIACALGLLPATASAEASGSEPLAPSLQELAKPGVRALSRSAQARRLGIAASGPGSLIREDGRILVEARFDSGAIARLPALRAAGGEVLASSQQYQEATVNVPFADLEGLAEVPGLAAVTPVRAPVARAPEPCQGGSVISEGIGQLNVEGAREAYPLEGSGETVGVLSDSLDQATEQDGGGGQIATRLPEDVAANELPGEASSCEGEKSPVRELRPYAPVRSEQPPTDEGRAMLQIVHDVAPRAKLAFNSAFNGELAFAEGIERLAAPAPEGAEANVIVDDVSYFEEPFFQDGPVAASINKVVDQGVTYLTAAGNDNLLSGGNEIASWEAPAFRDSGGCPTAVQSISSAYRHCLDFNPEAAVDRTFGITVLAHETLTVDLQWAEPWFGVKTDLDAFLLGNEGNLLTPVGGQERNLTTQKPVEVVQWTNESGFKKTVQLVVNKFTGGTPPVKFILLENGRGVSETEYPKSNGGDVVGPAIYGHAGDAAAITVGAVNYKNDNALESYSSRGPVTHYFGPVKGTSAAAALPAAAVIPKPDIVATDCGKTTFFSSEPSGEPGVWRFCGTSAAAPHAAGVAALMAEAGAKCSAQIAAGLESSALPVAGFGAEAAGAGLIEAKGALEAASGPLPDCPVVPPEYEPEVDEEEGSATPGAPPGTPTTPTQDPTRSAPPTNLASPDPKLAPSTAILAHPKKIVRTRRALARVVFRFGSNSAGASFRCQFDGSRWHRCTAKVSRWFGLGQHVVRVQARSAGLLDPTPAVYRFKVARSR